MNIVNVTNPGQEPVTGDWVEYHYDNGNIVKKTYHEPVEEVTPNYLYIHIAMTDGDGREPLGIKNDGIDSLGIVATFRASDDPVSPVITQVTGMTWRVNIRGSLNQIYDIIDVAFVDGIASVAYVTTDKADVCQVLESDFEQITVGETTYTLKLVGNTTFKVYRNLT